jgi:hypothetical protein
MERVKTEEIVSQPFSSAVGEAVVTKAFREMPATDSKKAHTAALLIEREHAIHEADPIHAAHEVIQEYAVDLADVNGV